MYRVADTKGSLRGEGVLLRICCIVPRLPMVFDGGGGGEGILLRIFCIVSRIPRVL